MKKLGMIFTVTLLLTWIATPAQAHILWLNVSNYSPRAGETLWLEIGFGHQYPRDEMMKEGRIERVYAINPDGQELNAQKVFPAFYKFTPQKQGTYVFVAILKSGFVSKTTDGHRLGTKKTLPGVVSCFAHRMNALAQVTVGTKRNRTPPGRNNDFEIRTLKNPTGLQPGDILPLQILFQGKPLAGADLKAACMGCSRDEKHAWVQEARSDTDGTARIELTSGGPWMFTASHEIPFPDPDGCDNYLYRTSLTLDF